MTQENKNDLSLNGGVLIIGSLYWDTEKIRVDWRDRFLDFKKARLVSAPIRYGRVSSDRKCTFTMVFSTECKQKEKLGQAWFVPFKNNPVDLQQLWEQCTELIKAETKKQTLSFKVYNWIWGALGLCINPKYLDESSEKYQQIESLKTKWQEKYGKQKKLQPNEFKVGGEESIFSTEGLLKIDWSHELDDVDFFIATATKPEIEEYPSIENIADRMIVNGYSEYFFKNVAKEIVTFQDEQIQELYQAKLTSSKLSAL